MRFLKGLLIENWGLKLTAIFLAFVLWLVVRGDPNAERVISVPLEVRVARNMEITSDRPTSVDVTVRGVPTSGWFGPPVSTYVLDLQSYEEGEWVVQLSPENVQFPRASGVEAIGVRPARMKVVLERTIVREVPIKVAMKGEPGPGMDVYNIYHTPSTAIISGPRSSIERLQEVSTETVQLTGRQQSFRVFENLDIKDDAVQVSAAGPVEVYVELGAHRDLHRITGVPVETEDATLRVTPRWITVSVLVPTTFGKPLNAADLIATVTAPEKGLPSGGVQVKPVVRLKEPLDPAILIKETQPAEVTLRKNR